MKYCMKCGTLLEDSHETCIGCGASVTEPGTYSLYPPEMAKSIEKEKKEDKSRMGLIAGLVAVFVLLVGVVSVFIIFNINKANQEPKQEPKEQVEEAEIVEEPEIEEVVENAIEEPESEPEVEVQDTEVANTSEDGRQIIDSAGRYYNVASVSDAGGNVVFKALYPEDFVERAVDINYEIYSTRYPEKLTYVIGNEEGNVQFVYMSPQHYWYRNSDNKSQTRSDERDVYDYMQFLKYDGAQGYIEALIKQSYTDIKNFKFIDKEEFSADITSKLADTSNNHTMELTGEIGDYAKIAPDTVYAAMKAECEGYIYHYEATSRQDNTIFMDFYVPVIANTLGYVTDREKDKGEVTEWLIPEFVSFEAGNEELHNLYKDAFKLFIYNAKLTDEFFYLNYAYSQEIEKAISVSKEPMKLNADKLKKLHGDYKSGADLGKFGNDVRDFLSANPATCVKFSGDMTAYALEDAKVGFYSEQKNKVFISPVEDEYPGSDYVDLEFQAGSESNSSEEASSESSSDSN